MNANRLLAAIYFNLLISQSLGAFSARNWLRELEDSGYDASIPPGALLDDNPTSVDISIFIESMGNFRPLEMDYEIDFYLSECWFDHRLDHNESVCFHLNVLNDMDKVWKPDLYFANSKETRSNDVTVPNHSFQICSAGMVRYSVRVNARMHCSMDLHRYPFDDQTCMIKLLPYGNNMSRLTLSWRDTSNLTLSAKMHQTDLKLKEMIANECNASYMNFGGQFSCLQAEFHLSRIVSESLLQIYGPSLIIVSISWISFWIDPTSVPGRIGLAVTTLLTSATQTAGLAFSMPNVGYAKALDVWLIVCLLFLFGCLLEFALVNMYTRRWQSWCRKRHGNLKKFPLLTMGDEQYGIVRSQMCEKYRERVKIIDKVSRVLFPALFAVFVLVYFIMYA